jgi:hypothetical protein
VVAAGNDGKAFLLEVIVGDAEMRSSSALDKLQFNRMPHFFNPAEPDNVGEAYRQLLAEIVHRCPGGVPTRAAPLLAQDNLAGDVTEAISYPRPGAYLEDLTWLVWRLRQPLNWERRLKWLWARFGASRPPLISTLRRKSAAVGFSPFSGRAPFATG